MPLPTSTHLCLLLPASACLFLPLPASSCLCLFLPASNAMYRDKTLEEFDKDLRAKEKGRTSVKL